MKSIFDEEVRIELIARIDSLQPGTKAQWGTMTAEQMVRHCILTEEYYRGKIAVKRSFLGRILGRIAINAILKDDRTTFRKNSMTAPQFKVTNSVNHFEDNKQKWQALIEQYKDFNSKYFTHWFFGKMTRDELGKFIYKHSDHHLNQFGS